MKIYSVSLFILIFSTMSFGNPYHVHYLDNGMLFNRTDHQTSYPVIYCYKGSAKNIFHLLETVQLKLNLEDRKFEQFDGLTPEEVMKQFDEHKSSWNLLNFVSSRENTINLYPFHQTCTGIVTSQQYTIQLQLIRVDFRKVLALAAGLLLFRYAYQLSKNNLFYYLTGVSVGTLGSYLIVIFLLSRLFPRKPVMYTFLIGGWSTYLYLGRYFLSNLKTVALEYKSHVLTYTLFASLISFGVCYRYGPVSNVRTINLIRWTLQGFALCLIYCSSQLQEGAVTVILMLLIYHNVPSSGLHRAAKIYNSIFWWPRPRKLLSEEEFEQEATMETKKALDDLRGYCSSPDCNQWKTVLKLKDPLRFARFVQGESHLSDAEFREFERRNHRSLLYSRDVTDDENDSLSD